MVEVTQAPPDVNVTLAREADGQLAILVGGQRILGVATQMLQPVGDGTGMLMITIPTTRIRFAEATQIIKSAPNYDADGNIVAFPKMRAAQNKDWFDNPRPPGMERPSDSEPA